MAFGFANHSNAMGGNAASGAGGLTQGPDLEVIQTEVRLSPLFASCTRT